MKQFRNWMMVAMLFFVAFIWTSCNESTPSHSKAQTEATGTEAEVADKAYDSKYVCPMHCEGSGSSQPGDCPVCHMHYIENKDYKEPH